MPTIEITPAMIEAGARVMRDHADGMIGPYSARHIAESVFNAMVAAKNASVAQSHE